MTEQFINLRDALGAAVPALQQLIDAAKAAFMDEPLNGPEPDWMRWGQERYVDSDAEPYTVRSGASTEEVIASAIGAASVCWTKLPSGVFEYDRAGKILIALVEWIDENYVTLENHKIRCREMENRASVYPTKRPKG